MESLLCFQERVDLLKKELIEQVKSELKSPYLAEFDIIDLGYIINTHFPDDGCALYYNIDSVCLKGETIVCRGYLGADTSDFSRFEEEAEEFDCETILRVLRQIYKIARETKLAKLRKLVTSSGDKLEFDGSFDFTGTINDDGQITERAGCKLLRMEITDGNLIVSDSWDGNIYSNPVCDLSDNELTRLLEFAEKQVNAVDISLNEEQLKAVNEAKAALKHLFDLEVECIYDTDYGCLQFFSMKGNVDFEIKNCAFTPGEEFINVEKQLEDCPLLEGISYYNSLSNEELFVKPKS